MPKTISEKILADHSGKPEVFPEELVEVRIDFALGNDITAPLAIEAFRRAGAKKVFDRERISLAPDHFVPNKDIASAIQARMLSDFAKEFDLQISMFSPGLPGCATDCCSPKAVSGAGATVCRVAMPS